MRRWIGSISESVEHDPTRTFTLTELRDQDELFLHRAALFFTPSGEIPPEHVGSGPLDVTLPITTPDWTDFFIIRAYAMPQLWVDLLQRATAKIRWTYFHPAFVRFTRYDVDSIRTDHLATGTKALLDALKVRTHGRSDGRLLHYFGAIWDDGPGQVEVEWRQEVVRHPADARIRIEVTAPDARRETIRSAESLTGCDPRGGEQLLSGGSERIGHVQAELGAAADPPA
ncbi:hypothetical protein [Fimbriiglobus ruber]|uniref:hypothetical protein n=1 Tax=Fimbriiglobus ruber TaxID=1908690 RepID=UPI000B4A7803|nr:hypothetical protein [Fimbriiglobus ruber]